MQITHIKITKGVSINYTEPAKDENGTNHYKLESQEEPVPEFKKSLQALDTYVPQIMDIPASSMKDLRVTGITFVDKKDILGFTITSNKPVSSSNSPAVFNTPIVYESKDGGHPTLPKSLFEHIEVLKAHAADYVKGLRAEPDQRSMFE